jgi:hypothetical protein
VPASDKPAIRPIWVRPATACEIGGFGLTSCYEMMNSGVLKSVRVDGKRLVSVASIEQLGESLKPADIGISVGRGRLEKRGRRSSTSQIGSSLSSSP